MVMKNHTIRTALSDGGGVLGIACYACGFHATFTGSRFSPRLQKYQTWRLVEFKKGTKVLKAKEIQWPSWIDWSEVCTEELHAFCAYVLMFVWQEKRGGDAEN